MDKINIILHIVEQVLGIGIALNGLPQIYVLIIVITSFIMCFLSIKNRKEQREYKKINQYMRFVEFLFDNEKHRFVLLPKLRLYLNSKKINNKLQINELDIIYCITPCLDNKLNGDLKISYRLKIENKAIPEKFDFITSNDFSDETQNFIFKYGAMTEFQSITTPKVKASLYWKGLVRHYSIAIEEKNIPKSGDIVFEMQISCKKSFDFENLKRDTIICLPKIFSDDIKKITYHINLDEFKEMKFYCDAYKISEEDREFNIRNIPLDSSADTSFKITLLPNEVKGEKAYYFRVGLSENDSEEMM